MGDGDKCEVEGNLTVLFFFKTGRQKMYSKVDTSRNRV